MKRFAPLLLLFLSGCFPPNETKPGPEDEPAPVSAVEQAAEQSIRDYAAGLAHIARVTSDKSTEFKTNAEVFDSFAKQADAMRDGAFEAVAKAMDEAVKPTAGYSAEAVKRAFDDQAKGFERAAKK